jgi:hypothetical protein
VIRFLIAMVLTLMCQIIPGQEYSISFTLNSMLFGGDHVSVQKKVRKQQAEVQWAGLSRDVQCPCASFDYMKLSIQQT